VAAGGDVVEKGHTEKEALFAKDAFAKVSSDKTHSMCYKHPPLIKLDF